MIGACKRLNFLMHKKRLPVAGQAKKRKRTMRFIVPPLT